MRLCPSVSSVIEMRRRYLPVHFSPLDIARERASGSLEKTNDVQPPTFAIAPSFGVIVMPTTLSSGSPSMYS